MLVFLISGSRQGSVTSTKLEDWLIVGWQVLLCYLLFFALSLSLLRLSIYAFCNLKLFEEMYHSDVK